MAPGKDWATIFSSVIALAAYYNTWESGFVYDDNRAILSNDDVLPQSPLLNLLRHDFWGTPLEHSGSHGSYRPLAVLSFRLNVALAGGRSPRGFHVLNILLHAAATACFTRWTRILTRRHLTPWISGLLFAVHPIHTEAVAGIVGRADVGAALFFMLSLISYHEHTMKNDLKYLVITLVLGSCAMFTKEQGITVFAVCVVYELVAHPTTIKAMLSHNTEHDVRRVRSISALLGSALLLFVVRTWITGGNFPTFAAADNPASRCDSFFTRTLTFLYLPVFNFCLLLCPSTLSFDWSMDAIPLINSVFDYRNIGTILFYSALIWYNYTNLINIQRSVIQYEGLDNTENSVDVNSNVNIVKKSVSYTKVETSYQSQTANMFLNDVLSAICTSFPHWYTKPIFSTFNIVLHKLGKSISSTKCLRFEKSVRQESAATKSSVKARRSYVRRHDCILVMMSMSIMVISFIPASNLLAYVGFVVAERILYIPSLGFCLLVGHGFSTVIERLWIANGSNKKLKVILMFAFLLCVLLAFIMKTITRNHVWSSEEALYRSGIGINPAKAYGNLGNILSMKGQYEEAESCYRKALHHRPNMADVHYNLGVLLQTHQRLDEAMYRYRIAIQFRPRLAVAHLNLGLLLARVQRVAEAKAVLRHCSELDGSGLRDLRTHQAARVACLFHLGRIAMEQGQLEEAVNVFLQAVHNRPHFYAPQSLFNMLGEAYSRMGRDADAEPWFQASLSSRPDHVPAHLTYGKLLARNNVHERLELRHLQPSQGLFHYLTGHGPYVAYLKEKGIADSNACSYGEINTPEHVVWECPFRNYYKRTRLGEAEDWYMRAERLAPGDAAVFRHYGQFLLSQKRYSEAAAKLEHAISLSGTAEYEDFLSAATSLRLAGDFAGAEKYYKLAISRRPQESSSWANLGALYHLIGRLEEAEARYRKALKLQPDDEVTTMNLKRLKNLKATQDEKQKMQRN